MLVEELDYILFAQSRATLRHDITVLQKHKKSLQIRFTNHFNLENDLIIDSSSEVSTLSAEYLRKFSLPMHLI